MTLTLMRMLDPVVALGRFSILLARSFRSLGEVRLYGRNIFEQMVKIGIESIPIVSLAALFSGAVTTMQTAYQLVSPFIPVSVIGAIVVPSIILELGAVVT
ncbi:MAG: ABC transporter permease, partial [Bacteroidetes bacterium]|nr:ABC transporter permease [Bacteroidota bacterium]